MESDNSIEDRWVNARIEILVPLDVTIDSDPHLKTAAITAVVEDLLARLTPEQAQSWAIAASWERASSRNEVGT